MTPPVTTWTSRPRGDHEHNDWVEGSHSEDRTPQYNLSNVASAQEADQTTAVGDRDLYDMALAVQYTGEYLQTIQEFETTDDAFVLLGRPLGIESFEARMSGRISNNTREDLNNQSDIEDIFVVGRNVSVQHESIRRWIPAVPGYPVEGAAEQRPGMRPSSEGTESHVKCDDSDWVDIPPGSTNIDRDTQGLGSVFSTFPDWASNSDELELD